MKVNKRIRNARILSFHVPAAAKTVQLGFMMRQESAEVSHARGAAHFEFRRILQDGLAAAEDRVTHHVRLSLKARCVSLIMIMR